MSVAQLAESFERAEAALSPKEPLSSVLAWMRGGERLALFGECLRDRMFVEAVRGFDRDVRMGFVKQGSIGGGFCLIFCYYDRALNVRKACNVKRCVEREQRVYARS